MDWRKLEESFFRVLMLLSLALVVGSLILILLIVLVKGLPALSWAMVSQTPKGGYYLGKEGGILNAILGSFYLGIGATFLSFVLSLPVVLYMHLYAPKSRLANWTRLSLDVLWGTPSIVYGAFAFTIMLAVGIRASLLGGIIAVALLEFPILCRGMDEVIKMVPHELTDASFALGATRLETAFKIVVRQALPGILTAVLLAFGRGIGDAASVLFTTGYTDYLPTSPMRPTATLPLAVFFQLATPFPEVQQRAYASALVLTALILIISTTSRILSKRFTKHILK
jgi:phosphate transport system permease protein